MIVLYVVKFKWCLGPDLNRHGINSRGILSPLCLPIPPPRQNLNGGDTRIRTGDQSFAGSCLSHLAMSPNKSSLLKLSVVLKGKI